jgi:methylation protein EvaC
MEFSPCRICKSQVFEIISFGKMPIANAFVEQNLQSQYRFNLVAGYCTSCYMFQLLEQPNPDQMFHSSYPFFTGLSVTMKKHFQEMSENHIPDNLIKNKESFIIEIGCNDGTFLQNVMNKNIKHLGVDPSKNVVEKAQEKGINAVAEFYSYEASKTINEKYGKANRIFASNVICHIPDMHDFMRGIKNNLSPEGEFIFEEPYLLSMLKKTSYDQLYDEHVYMFSLMSIQKLAEMNDLILVDAIPQETHGGSMRYVLKHSSTSQKISSNGLNLLNEELTYGLDKLQTYQSFAKNCETRKNDFVKLLQNLKLDNKVVGGYAATSKSTTVLNYCGIDKNLIGFISDSTPEKIGTVAPGSNIPIISHEEMREIKPDYLVLFAWNHEKEIMEKEHLLTRNGMKWIRFVPEVGLVNEK